MRFGIIVSAIASLACIPTAQHVAPIGQRRLMVHRAGPKISNPNGPCSTILDVAPTMQLAGFRSLVATHLGFEVARFTLDDAEVQDLLEVPDGAFLAVYEKECETTESTNVSLFDAVPVIAEVSIPKTVLVHREAPKFTNLNGFCSAALQVSSTATVSELQALVGERLRFPVAYLQYEGKEVHSVAILPEGAFLSAYEVAVRPCAAKQEEGDEKGVEDADDEEAQSEHIIGISPPLRFSATTCDAAQAFLQSAQGAFAASAL